jgi:Cytochrome P460
MKIHYAKTLTFLLVFGLCILAAEFLSRPVISEVEPSISVALSGNEVIVGYKQWTLVNPKPQRIDPVDAGLCRAPLPIDLAHMEGGPHVGKFISVYVNEIGKLAMMEQREPRFPEGSVIVKEKLSKGPTMVGFSPFELLTVMRKREAGYDPNKGDWEYLVFDGSGKTLQASGKLANCQACHTRFEQADYIARTYLTVEARQKLR